MTDTKRFERDPAEGGRATVEKQLQKEGGRQPAKHGGVPAETFPPFDDPAFSNKPAEPPAKADAPPINPPPKDTQCAGHPDFSQDAAQNEPLDGLENDDGDDHETPGTESH